MNKLIIFLVCLIFTVSQQITFSAEKEQHLDDIAVTVNGKIIKQEDVARRLQNFQDVTPKELKAARLEIIDQLITDILLDEFIDKQGIIVTQSEVEEEVRHIKNNTRDTLSLEEVLDSVGSNMNEFKTSIRHSIALEKYFNNRLDNRALENYFEKNKSLFNGESVRVSHILIDIKNLKTQEEYSGALEQIKNIKQELEQGNNFEEAAKKYSHCPSALSGGDLGFIQRKSILAEAFLDTAFSLPVGMVGGPVLTEYGYHLIKVTERKEGLKINFEDVEDKVRSAVLDAEILKLLDRLRNDAQIAVHSAMLK
ncbi:MAG: hypothetical protein E3K32_10040 [wastewater metagenome]|nr:hypothetical protein [Candidatus Loosdrechtia aerotolerans]